jgi:hypothetical protein
MLGEPIIVLLCAVGFCVLGLIGSFFLNFLSIALNILGGLIGVVFEVLASGPIGWCGCIVAVGLACGVVSLIGYLISIIPNCGTAQAVNLCRLLGY